MNPLARRAQLYSSLVPLGPTLGFLLMVLLRFFWEISSMESYPFLTSLLSVRSILLVDDDSDDAFLLKRDLVRAFPRAEIHDASFARVLLGIAEAAPDLLVSAYRHQGVADLSYISRIREAGSRLPIVIISGMARYRDQVLEAGADLFLAHEEVNRIPGELLSLRARPSPRNLSPSEDVSVSQDKDVNDAVRSLSEESSFTRDSLS